MKKIIKQKQQEAKKLYREFDENFLKAAAYSVGGDFLSISLNLKENRAPSLVVEVPSSRSAPETEFPDPTTFIQYFRDVEQLAGMIVDFSRITTQPQLSLISIFKSNLEIPVLLRDYFIDPIQLYQAKTMGVDGVIMNYHFHREYPIGQLIEAASEMGLEIFLEIDDLSIPETSHLDGIDGLIFKVGAPWSRESLSRAVRQVREVVPSGCIILLDYVLPEEEDAAWLKDLNFQGLILNLQFWKNKDPLNTFRRILSYLK